MKYAVLDEFKAFLRERYASRATVKQYHAWAVRLLEGQFFSDRAGADVDAMAAELERKTKNRNEYSQAKNSLLNFVEFAHKHADIPALQKPKKRRHRKLKTRKLENINHKINVIPDKKLTLCYKTMLATGLRVGELASIETCGIQACANGGYSLAFVPKGGGLDRVIIPAGETYLCKGIAALMQPGSNADRAFYSAGYLQENATLRGFACHDLRRAFAKITYRDSGGKLAYTSERMRHASPRTTKIYLNSKVVV